MERAERTASGAWVWAAAVLSACGADGRGHDASAPDTSAFAEESAPDTMAVAEESAPDTMAVADEVAEDVAAETDVAPPEPFAARPMTFRITSSYASDGSFWRVNVGGLLYVAPPPSLYTEVDREGDCRLLQGANPFCAAGCSDGLCTAPDVCTPWPAAASAGRITLAVAASGADPIAVDPAPSGYSWNATKAPFGPGDTLTIAAAGDAVPAFSAELVQPAAIALTNYDRLDLDGAAPLTLTWTVPPVGSLATTRVRIRLQEDRAQHGRAYPGILECDVADTGSFTIPERLRAAYANHDNFTCGKCPQSFLTRYSKTTVRAGDFAIDLIAESEVGFLLTFIYPRH